MGTNTLIEERPITMTLSIVKTLPAIILLVGSLTTHAAAQNVIRVDVSGPVASLGDAVARAMPGDEIVVGSGTLVESGIVVDKPLAIRGEEGAVIESVKGDQIITILSDDVTIEGLTLKGVSTSFVDDRSAIRVERAANCRIAGNRIDDGFFGIYLARATSCTIEDNVLTASKGRQTQSGNGIHLWHSTDVDIRGNIITGHRDGIYLEFASGVHVAGNRASRNLRYGLHFMFSDDCDYDNNEFVDNEAGVAVMYSKNVSMRGNRFVDNWGPNAFGLLLKDITDSSVSDNVFLRNTVGLYADGANRITVHRNDFIENGRAVRIMANSLDSEFRHNNFSANTFDVTTNGKQSFSAFEQNFWDGYRGYDLDRDGIGDVPFYPVRLFALIVERNEPAIILMRSLFVDLLDAAERVVPLLIPKAVVDASPLMRPFSADDRSARHVAVHHTKDLPMRTIPTNIEAWNR